MDSPFIYKSIFPLESVKECWVKGKREDLRNFDQS